MRPWRRLERVRVDLTRVNDSGMNYIELINNFWEFDEVWQFSCCETRLYFYLVKTANRLGWENSWTHSDDKTAANVGVSLNSMKSARNRLIQSGLIAVKSGGKGFRNKTRYQILTPKPTPKYEPNHIPRYEPNQQPINKDKDKRKQNSPDTCPPPGDDARDPVKFSEKKFIVEVVEFFNENCKGLPPVKVITDKRKESILARYREHGCDNVFMMMRKAGTSKFLAGQGKGGFMATFDWIFRPINFVKTLEGNYDDRNGNDKTGEDLNDKSSDRISGETQPDYSERF